MVRKMKVTQSSLEKVFDPITIVLETEEEAAIMWVALVADVRQSAIDAGDIDLSGLRGTELRMFDTFGKTYDATEGRYAR